RQMTRFSLPPFDREVDLKMVGVIADPRIKSLWLMKQGLDQSIRDLTPDFETEDEFDKWFMGRTIGEIELIKTKSKRIIDQQLIVEELLISGIREGLKLGDDCAFIGV